MDSRSAVTNTSKLLLLFEKIPAQFLESHQQVQEKSLMIILLSISDIKYQIEEIEVIFKRNRMTVLFKMETLICFKVG